MNAPLRTTDLGVLILYMIGVFGLGCWFARKSGKPEEFMAAGRSLPGWAVGLSIFGTFVSSIGFLGNAGAAYGANWNAWVFGLSLPIAAVAAVKWFIPLYRSEQEVSAYYHLEKRFGPWARTYAMICYLLSQLARIGTILYLVALALAPLTGWSIPAIIVVTGILVTIYTLLGGIEAVIWTDVVQSFVLMGGAILCSVLLLTGMPEGSGQLFEIAKEHDKFSLGSFDPFIFTQATFWVVLLYGIFINLQNFGIDQSFVQRYATAKSDRDARFSVLFASFMLPVVSAVFFFIGTGLFSYYQTDAKMLGEVKAQVAKTRLVAEGEAVTDAAVAEKAAQLSSKDVGDKVLPHFIVNKLPVGVAGLLIAAIFAAAMSSMDTSLNSAATLYLCDVHKRYFRPNADEKESMRVLHTATLVVGIAGTIAAMAMIRVQSALQAWWKLQGIFTGGMLGLFLLGLISRRIRNPQAIAAVIFGTLVILWMTVSKMDIWPESLGKLANPLHGNLIIVLGTSSIVILGVLLAQIFGSSREPARGDLSGGSES